MITFTLIGAAAGVFLDRKFPGFVDKVIAGLAWLYAKLKALILRHA